MADSPEFLMDQKVIVVLGPAGAGKTTFINLATGRDDSGVGHDIGPGTTEIGWVRAPQLIHGRSTIFIDTPGLDDTEKQDTEIVTMITDSLGKTKFKLDTLVYLHPISDNRIPSSGLQRLKLLTSLWKIDRIPNFVIVTTMWDEVKEEIGEKRETELKSKFWAGLIANGCEVKRFHRTTQSALEALRPSSRKVIVVMGPSAAGKTTFINFATQRGDHGIGHDIEPGTIDVEWIGPSQPIEGHNILFMDTPGLDDARKSDRETVIMIKASLEKAKLNPDMILYLHPISTNRMPESELKRLNLFMDSWDIGRVPNVVIVTTMWDEVKEEIGEKRETELKSKFWAGLIANGCEVKRFHRTTQSALDILRPSLTKTATSHPMMTGRTVPDGKQAKNLLKELNLLQRLLREIFQRLLNSSRMRAA